MPAIVEKEEKANAFATRLLLPWFRSTAELAMPKIAFGPQGKVCCSRAMLPADNMKKVNIQAVGLD